MKKLWKIKRRLSVILIVILSINSLAAIVSDNDGSAFVTKAEFDALKNSFNKQIDDYNASIDGKIDGAIASYLSGIQIAKTTIVPNNYSKYVINGANTSWPLLWSSAKTSSDMNATEKNYFGSNINCVPIVKYAVLQTVLNVHPDEKQAWIFGGAAYEGRIGNASYNDFIDIYKLSNSGEVVSAFRTTIYVTLIHINQSSKIVDQVASTSTIPGFPGAYISDYNFGTKEVYTNLHQCGRLWAQGLNLKGESAQWTTSKGTWTGANDGTTLADAKATSFVDEDTTVPPCVYPFGGTSIKVNASKENVDAFVFISKSNGKIQTGENHTLASVSSAIKNQGLSMNFGSDNGNRRLEWSEKITIKHNNYPTGLKCTQSADASQFVFQNFKIVDDRNDKICNGLVLCDVEKKGILKVTLKPSNKGKIYLWQANASEDTWGGRKSGATINESLFPYNVNVTTAGIVWERSFEVEPSNGPVWMVYAPNAGTSGGSLQGSINDVEVTLTLED